jgi:hypothetical protein
MPMVGQSVSRVQVQVQVQIISENGKSRSFRGPRANDLIAHPTGKLIGEWRREYEKGNGLGFKVVDAVPGEWDR